MIVCILTETDKKKVIIYNYAHAGKVVTFDYGEGECVNVNGLPKSLILEGEVKEINIELPY